VRLANFTEYGLAAAVYTTDLTKAHRVAKLVRAGQVGVNCAPLFHAPPACPWAGHKGSGFGYHSGADGWRQFSAPKSLVHEGAVPTDTALMADCKATLLSKL
jgi:acyl-CoA reductase-like NAD-dependent aldehyde dehydrogenase